MSSKRSRIHGGLAIVCLALGGCAASIPQGSYGVTAVDLHGADHFDDEAIKACLATYPREHFGFVLGGGQAPQCGTPPFDRTRIPVNLWTWPWTEWPIYNETAFDRDLDRIERWYVARGYYDAKVTSARCTRTKRTARSRSRSRQGGRTGAGRARHDHRHRHARARSCSDSCSARSSSRSASRSTKRCTTGASARCSRRCKKRRTRRHRCSGKADVDPGKSWRASSSRSSPDRRASSARSRSKAAATFRSSRCARPRTSSAASTSAWARCATRATPSTRSGHSRRSRSSSGRGRASRSSTS